MPSIYNAMALTFGDGKRAGKMAICALASLGYARLFTLVHVRIEAEIQAKRSGGGKMMDQSSGRWRNLRRWWQVLGAMVFMLVPVSGADRIIVMPFENRSQLSDYNWVRESFPITLAQIMDVPGIVVLGVTERDRAFERLRLSPTDLLTRASMIRVAELAQANLALIGEYDIGGERDEMTISIRARLVETTEGRLGANRVFNFSGPLANLQQMQGQLAWNIVYLRDPSLPYTKEQFVERLTAPPLAYQSYLKGVQTLDLKLRENFLRRAIQEYDSAAATGHYGAAIYELGLLGYRQGKDAEAVQHLRQLDRSDTQYESGLFHLGLAAFRVADYSQMVAALTELAKTRSVLEVLNNLAIGHLGKGESAAAIALLQRVVANAPQDPVYRFNYGYALWRDGQLAEAIPHLRLVVARAPRASNANDSNQDGEALFLLARSLAATGAEGEAAKFDNDARRYLPGYAKWTVDPAAIPLLGRIRHDFDPLGRLPDPNDNVSPETLVRQGLERVRQALDRNDENAALLELDNLRRVDDANVEVAFLRGAIHQRRGESEAALTALQVVVARDPRHFDAHLLLGRIYLARNDRARASAHANQALAIDPSNRAAISLKQQIESGR